MQVKIAKVSPNMAKKFLENNLKNRDLREHRIWQFVQMMERGTFVEDGTPIKLNGDGGLLDGQHRLYAILRTGRTYTLPVVSGLPDEAFDSTDRCMPRNTGDSFKKIGEKNYSLSAAFFGRIIDYVFHGSATGRKYSKVISDTEKAKFLDAFPTSRDAVALANSLSKHLTKTLSPAPLATLIFLSTYTPQISWRDYWTSVATGDNIKYQGARLYRKLLIGNLQAGNRKLGADAKLGYGIVAFNKDATKSQVKHLKLVDRWPAMVNVPDDELRAFFRLPEES
jgi:hypothetical protein